MNKGKQLRSSFLLHWIKEDEVFPSSYGRVTGVEFCHKLQKSIFERKGIETILVYKEEPMATFTQKYISLKLVYEREREYYDHRNPATVFNRGRVKRTIGSVQNDGECNNESNGNRGGE